jgi:dTDP-4-amino-4,6-dideoxygalactose transaminase
MADRPISRRSYLCARHHVFLVEDAAQAVGATYRGRGIGSVGHVGCFSFYPTKPLGAYGDGGLITSRAAGVAGWTSCRRRRCA